MVPLAALAQRLAASRAVGFLGPASAEAYGPWIESLRAGLRDLGYVEGVNIRFEFRYGEGSYEAVARHAADLVRENIDVIVTSSTPATFEAKRATARIPIVMALVSDPVDSGLVASLAKPGGNVTGTAYFVPEMNGKRVELLKEMLPSAKLLAVLVNPENVVAGAALRQTTATASALRIQVYECRASKRADFQASFAAAAERRADALLIIDDPIFNAHAEEIGMLAMTHRLPAIGSSEFVLRGGVLMSYMVDQREMFRRAAAYVDKVFKGAKPAELPIDRSSRFELVVNQKAARALGVRVPQSILVRADRVIQ